MVSDVSQHVFSGLPVSIFWVNIVRFHGTTNNSENNELMFASKTNKYIQNSVLYVSLTIVFFVVVVFFFFFFFVVGFFSVQAFQEVIGNIPKLSYYKTTKFHCYMYFYCTFNLY